MIQGLEGVLQWLNGSRQILDEAIVIAMEGLVGTMGNRIHVEGLASDGGPISSGYSTKPFFALTKDFVNKGRIPKALISSTGQSVQLPAGYQDFRRFSGRQVDKVDLKYTGHLQTSLRSTVLEAGAYAVGFVGTQKAGQFGSTAAAKAGYLEGLYGKDIWTPSEQELDETYQAVLFEWVNRSV